MEGKEGTSVRFYPSLYPATLSSRETMGGLSDRGVRVRLVHSRNDFKKNRLHTKGFRIDVCPVP